MKTKAKHSWLNKRVPICHLHLAWIDRRENGGFGLFTERCRIYDYMELNIELGNKISQFPPKCAHEGVYSSATMQCRHMHAIVIMSNSVKIANNLDYFIILEIFSLPISRKNSTVGPTMQLTTKGKSCVNVNHCISTIVYCCIRIQGPLESIRGHVSCQIISQRNCSLKKQDENKNSLLQHADSSDVTRSTTDRRCW